MAVERVEVRSVDQGSEITYRSELTLRGVGRVLRPRVARRFERATADAAWGLVGAVEGRRLA